MADANIKKTRILKSLLPPIDHDTLKYTVEYTEINIKPKTPIEIFSFVLPYA